MTPSLRIVFAGTPGFAVPALNALIESHHLVVAAYTQPDRPAGRGRRLQPSAVKSVAEAHGIPVEQPVTLKEAGAQEGLRAYRPDVMVVAAYGLILPQAVLDIPPMGCLNIHASLLPRWRGAAPIQRAMLAGDRQTGITIMQMSAGLDSGDMLARYSCAIHPEDTAQTLHDRLSMLGAQGMLEVLEGVLGEGLTPEPQDAAQATYAPKIEKAEAELAWEDTAQGLARRVQAFNPWPVAFTYHQGRVLRIWSARAVDEGADASPGTVVAEGRGGIDVATGHGILRIHELQMAGGRALQAGDFINARSLKGAVLPN